MTEQTEGVVEVRTLEQIRDALAENMEKQGQARAREQAAQEDLRSLEEQRDSLLQERDALDGGKEGAIRRYLESERNLRRAAAERAQKVEQTLSRIGLAKEDLVKDTAHEIDKPKPRKRRVRPAPDLPDPKVTE